VILTHDEVLPKLTRITVAPITSTVRGVASEVLLNENDGLDGAVNLHNVMSVVPERLADRITQLSAARLREICRALNFALGCQAPGI
jgi:mRNA interferase MazF